MRKPAQLVTEKDDVRITAIIVVVVKDNDCRVSGEGGGGGGAVGRLASTTDLG